MIRIVPLTCAALVCCGRSSGVPDDQLGNLVVEPSPPAKIDVAAAAGDVDELSRALASSHSRVLAALGPHSVSIDTKTIVTEGGQPVSELSDHTTLEMGDRGAFKAVYTNSADYGREAIYVPAATPPARSSKPSGRLFLRPRYQRWHGRTPETIDEPAQLRDSYFSPIAATWDLLAPGAELTDRGTVTFSPAAGGTVAGRAGRKIAVKLSPTPRTNPPETLTQRMWRTTRSIQEVAGEVVVDADSGMPMAVKLAGAIAFSRDGRRFTMKVELDARITTFTAIEVAAPPESDVVATPERSREVDERDFLLGGIAPPIRKNPDGTAVPPTVIPAPAGNKPKAQAPSKESP